MTRSIRSGLVAIGLATALGACGEATTDAPQAPAIDEAAVLARTNPLAQSFAGALQGQLKEALAAGGPMLAVGVCKEAAPQIAAEQSSASGAVVRRVSDRNRNPDGGLSEDLRPHYAMLAETPVVDGKPATQIWRSAAAGEGGEARINVLRAIPMQEQPCSVCHGTEIDPDLKAHIDTLYPGDAATGFEPGDLRGALLVSWPASEFEG